MSSDPSTSSTVDQSIVRMQQRLTDLAKTQGSIRWWTAIMVILLVAQSLLFVWGLYGSVQRNFMDQQRVIAAVTPRLQAMYPQFRSEATNLLYDVGPVYKDLIVSRFQAAAPQLIEGFDNEIRSLVTDLQTDTRNTLEISLNRVAKRIKPDIDATFPVLADPAALDRITKHFETRVHDEFGQLGLKLDTMYQIEAKKIWNALVALSPEPDIMAEKVELERTLLHHLIQLADYELLHAGEPDSATQVFLELFHTGNPHAVPTRN